MNKQTEAMVSVLVALRMHADDLMQEARSLADARGAYPIKGEEHPSKGDEPGSVNARIGGIFADLKRLPEGVDDAVALAEWIGETSIELLWWQRDIAQRTGKPLPGGRFTEMVEREIGRRIGQQPAPPPASSSEADEARAAMELMQEEWAADVRRLQAKIAAADAATQEARNNERTAMSWLSSVRAEIDPDAAFDQLAPLVKSMRASGAAHPEAGQFSLPAGVDCADAAMDHLVQIRARTSIEHANGLAGVTARQWTPEQVKLLEAAHAMMIRDGIAESIRRWPLSTVQPLSPGWRNLPCHTESHDCVQQG